MGDGDSRGQGITSPAGDASVGVRAYQMGTRHTQGNVFFNVGRTTNNAAERIAMVAMLSYAWDAIVDSGAKGAVAHSDSKLVVSHIKRSMAVHGA